MTPARSRRPGAPTRTERGIPEATVARLPVYLRALTALSDSGIATASSEDLATAAGVNSAKLRKDLSYLGSYGTRGVGYDVEYLRYQIAREIGVTQDWAVVIVGIGNLGHALANYSGFGTRGFRIVALLDADPSLVGERIGEMVVRDFAELEEIVASDRVSIGVITTRPTCPGGLRPPGRRRGDEHPELRAGGAVRARRRRHPQGGPLDRVADPGVPRTTKVRRGGAPRGARATSDDERSDRSAERRGRCRSVRERSERTNKHSESSSCVADAKRGRK